MRASGFGPRLRSTLGRIPVREEVDEELAFHVEMRTREYVEAGMDPVAARAAAFRRFGDIDAVRRACRRIGQGRERDMRRKEWLGELRQDAAFAARQWVREPGFAFVAIVTLALGIGATAAVFSAVHAVVLRPFPFPEPDRVVLVQTTWRGQPGSISVGNYLYIQGRSRSYTRLAAAQYVSFNLAEGDAPERVTGARVTHDYFEVFGVPPLLGRTFLAEEDQPGRERVVVLSHRLWSRRFGSDPAVVGRSVRIGGLGHEVVGVMPASFDFTADSEELWAPIAFTPERRAMYDEHFLSVFGRLAPGVTLGQANDELTRIVPDLVRDHPQENQERGALAEELGGSIVGSYRERLLILLGAVTLVLLIACANVTSLLLARGAARAREMAVRAALGAGRARIVRQLLSESLMLAGAGALAGLAVAWLGLRALLLASPPGVPRLERAEIDGAVLAFTAAVAIVSSVVFGLAPALHACRHDLRSGLVEGRGAVAGGSRDRLRRALVAGEVALALVLLAGAGLLIRSGLRVRGLDPGFDPRGVLTARVLLPRSGYEGHEKPARAFARMAEVLSASPGVAAATVTNRGPLVRRGGTNGLVPEGRPMDLKSAINSIFTMVSPGYFEVLRIPLRQGRTFTTGDRRGSPRVMIVNETLAQVAWPGEDPIGKRISCCEGEPDDPRWKEVVGVVADVRTVGLGERVEPEFYLPIDQVPEEAWDWIQRGMTLVARSERQDPAVLTGALRAAVRDVDPTVPLYDVATMDQRMRASTAQARFNTLLLSILGGVGLVLAAVGIYGVIAYFVSQRTREIGLRMALGATSRDVLALVIRQGMTAVLAGLIVGLFGSIAAGRALQAMLFETGSGDPVTLLAVVGVMSAVALLASGLPAYRASRVDPTRALAEM